MDVIYYHNDIDGVTCAALYAMLHPSKHFAFTPIATRDRSNFDKILENDYRRKSGSKIIVLDYQYSEFADVWFDHHRNSNINHNPNNGQSINWDTGKKSCFHLMCEIYGIEEPYRDLMHLVNMVDSAGYENVEYPFESTSPINALRIYLSKNMYNYDIVNLIVSYLVINKMDVSKTTKSLGLNIKKMLREEVRVSKKAKRDMYSMNGVGVLSVDEGSPLPKYSEYYHNKDMRFCIRYSPAKKGYFHIRLSKNPWIESPGNAADILQSISGITNAGGHSGIAGGKIKQSDEADVTTEIIMQLTQLLSGEDEMEKYGVDHEADPVEQEAIKVASEEGREVTADDREEASGAERSNS